MKNILFHSGEFWFNEKGFPQLLDFGVRENQSDKTEYFNALQLALADSVKFEDQDAILFEVRDVLFKTSTGMDGRNGWQPIKGQTFFIEGVEVKGLNFDKCPECGSKNIRYDETWGCGDCSYEWEKRYSRKVAVLSNSPVKSETPRRIRLDLNSPVELAIYEVMQMIEKMPADIKLTLAGEKLREARELVADFIDKVEPKAEPTVEGETWKVGTFLNGELFLSTGIQALYPHGTVTQAELQSIAALLNRAPLGEETKEKKPKSAQKQG